MFKAFFISLFISFVSFSQSYFTIEDENFALFLNQSYPSVIVGNKLNISSPRILEIKEMKLNGLNLHSIDGIQYFSNLRSLECIENSLTTLPELPKKLQRLDCSMNLLVSLPDLPSHLEELSCAQNLLTELPNLPAGLKILYCNFNQLYRLPILPSALEYLACGSNQLKCLPDLPTSIYMGDIAINPIDCLPSHETWMDNESLDLPICSVKSTGLSENECVCVQKSIVSNSETVKEEESQLVFSTNYEVEIYPNPVKDRIVIKSKDVINSIAIVDMNGQLISQIEVNELTAEMNMGNFHNGIYFIYTSFESKVVTSKVIKVQ